jgi:nucleoside-diphosphate-sugar epimerase
MLIKVAREKGVSAYIGDGLNCWPATHRLDTAHLFQLALDKGSAGSTFHAVAEEGVLIKDIAEVIGKQLNIPVVSKTMEEAGEHFGWLAFPLAANNPVSSEKTREKLGWSPVHPSLISDLKEGTYFKN